MDRRGVRHGSAQQPHIPYLCILRAIPAHDIFIGCRLGGMIVDEAISRVGYSPSTVKLSVDTDTLG